MVATAADELESGVLLVPIQLERRRMQKLSTNEPPLRRLEMDGVVVGLDGVREVKQAAADEAE